MPTGPHMAWQGSARRNCDRLTIGLCACLALASARASAQRTEAPAASDPSRDASARSLFEEGVKLAEDGEWQRAEDRFRRAYSLRSSAVIAYNLARALAEQGKLVEASEVLRRLEQDEKIEPAVMQSVQALQAELAPRIGRLSVQVRNPNAADRVLLDGQDLLPAQLGVEIPIDPGNHRLSLSRDGRDIDVQNIQVSAGKPAGVMLRAAFVPSPREVAGASSQAPPQTGPAPLSPPAAMGGELHDSDPITSRWWFWTAIGVVVAGGAVAIAVAASSKSGNESAFRGDFSPASVQVQVAGK